VVLDDFKFGVFSTFRRSKHSDSAQRGANMSTEVTFTVPDGVYAGDEFMLEYNGTELMVLCPDGCGPGDAISLQLDLPQPLEAESGDGPSQVTIVVPAGCYAGDEFTVEFNGQSFNICVPHGCYPGDELTVDVPEPEPLPSKRHDQKRKAAPSPAAAPAPAAEDPGYKFKPGQRVELIRSDGAYSPGTIVCGFEGVLDVMYKVQLDNGLFKEAVPEEDISDKCCEVGDLFDGL
jgi:hypothetical protein